MNVNDLLTYFEDKKEPKFYLTDVFSWRGCYSEVAFTPSRNGSREQSIEVIHRAITEVFEGWKGGEFAYGLDTQVHFEKQMQDCSDNALYNLLLRDNGN